MSTSSPSTPKPTLSLNRQHVLDEDEYTAALSDIIARDFFPSLVHLDATNSYLDALQSEDSQLINATVRRLQDLATPQVSTSKSARHSLQTPGRTPYATGPSDTPMATRHTENLSNKRPRYDTSLSLDSFQAKYTSEDNASFTEILDEENRKRKERWGWAWEAQARARDVKAIEMDKRRGLLIEDTASQPPGVRQRLVLEAPDLKLIANQDTTLGREDETPTGDTKIVQEARESTATAEDGESTHAVVKAGRRNDDIEVDVMAPKKDSRSAAVDGWSFKTRNALMFGPGADISPYDGPTSLPTSQPKGAPKEIKHANTRLPEQSNEDGDRATVPSSPSRSNVGAAIAGTPYVPRGERTEFPLLPSLPSPTPSQLGSVAVNQLMTWGTIASTPRVISSDPDSESAASSATPFHLPPPTPREKVAHKLSSTASRSLRTKASLLSGGTPTRSPLGFPLSKSKRYIEMGTKGTSRPHPGLLTPAARRLLDRTAGGGTSAVRRADVMSQESNWEGPRGIPRQLEKVRWTPSPSPVMRKAV